MVDLLSLKISRSHHQFRKRLQPNVMKIIHLSFAKCKIVSLTMKNEFIFHPYSIRETLLARCNSTTDFKVTFDFELDTYPYICAWTVINDRRA